MLTVSGLSGCDAGKGGKDGKGGKYAKDEATISARPERVDPGSAPLFPSTNKALAPDFEVTLLDGSRFSLKDARGKVMIMNIWATWCAPCKKETPDLVELYETYASDGLVVFGVSVDEQGESVVMPFVEEYSVSYPIFIDRSGEVMDQYGPTMGIPTTYIIDRSGYFRYFATGAVTKRELISKIEPLLAESVDGQ